MYNFVANIRAAYCLIKNGYKTIFLCVLDLYLVCVNPDG